jgi:hypothetical protein
MTCVVGFVTKDCAYMGSDSCAMSPPFLRFAFNHPKIITLGDMLIGYTGSFRIHHLLAHSFDKPPCDPGYDAEAYLPSLFIPELRKCFRKGGFLKRENSVESFNDPLLVAFQGRLFEIGDDLSLIEPRLPYYAIGCGTELALGALHAIYNPDGGFDPKNLLEAGLKSAAAFSAGVMEPFHFVSLAW